MASSLGASPCERRNRTQPDRPPLRRSRRDASEPYRPCGELGWVRTRQHFRDPVGERAEAKRLGYERRRRPCFGHMGIITGHEKHGHLGP